MEIYKYTFGKFGIDENYYITDIETGKHCLGKIKSKNTSEYSENITELKLPEDIDDFSINIPFEEVLITQGDTITVFGKLLIQHFEDSNTENKEAFNSLINNTLSGDKNAAITLIKNLAQAFYTIKDINDSNCEQKTFGELCAIADSLITDFYLRFKLVQKGAFSGNSDCMYLLGYYYEVRYGVRENQKFAFKWYLKAAKNGNVKSMDRLSHFYSWNNEACVINPYKSFYWTEKASQRGYIWDWERVGFSYMYGDGIARNNKKAIYWFKKICNLPDNLRKNCSRRFGEILYNLGYFSFYGISTKKDIHLAFDYFSKSADECYYLSYEALAYFYENGIIVKHSITKANEMLELKEKYNKK